MASPPRGRPAWWVLALVLSLTAGRDALAIDPDKALTQLVYDGWNTEQGLPVNGVHGLAQDRTGYLWVGTYQGVARFDGVRFTVFDRRVLPAIRSDWVLTLEVTRDDSVWLGTVGGGVGRLRDGVYTTFTTTEGLPSDTVTALLEARDGSLWVGTQGGGVCRLRNERIDCPAELSTLARETIFALAEDADGTLWIGADPGLFRLRGGKLERVGGGTRLSTLTVRALHRDRAGVLWIGTDAGGLWRIAGEEEPVVEPARVLERSTVRAIIEGPEGLLWLGTDRGVVRRHGTQFERWSPQEDPSVINVLLFGREGSLWIGTGADGLGRLKEGRFTTWSKAEGLTAARVWSVYAEGERLWVGTAESLDLFVDGAFRPFPGRAALRGRATYSLLRDRAGVLWAGTMSDGLFGIEPGGAVRQYSAAQGLGGEFVRALLEPHPGELWVGTNRGLWILEGGEVRRGPDALVADRINDLFQDSHGVVWAGTHRGLKRFENGASRIFDKSDGMRSEFVWLIHEDSAGALWLSTNDGLHRFKDGQFRVCTIRDGLYEDFINSIAEDELGRMWFGTNRGVFWVDKAELDAFMDGRVTSVRSTAYGRADGMESSETNGSGSAIARTADGALWFPTTRGVTRIIPAKAIPSVRTPTPVIESVEIEERELPVDSPGALELEPGTQSFLVRYTGLGLRAPERVTFRYRLEGFDREWVDAEGRREARYTNLEPGRYRFRLTARIGNGPWSEREAMLDLRLAPYFHQTWGFRVLVILVGVALALAAYLYRVHRLKQREAHLVREVAERDEFLSTLSHEMKTPLTILDLHLQRAEGFARTAPGKSEELLHSAHQQSRRLANLIENAVELSSIAQGDLPLEREPTDLVEVAREVIGRHAGALANAHSDVSLDAPEPVVGSWDRKRVSQSFESLLTNAIRYAGGRPIEVAIARDGAEAVLSVRDHGIGIAPSHHEKIFERFGRAVTGRHYGGLGLGLWFAREIVNAHGGALAVESAAGQGARFTMRLPLG